MPIARIKVLLVEDSPADRLLVQNSLTADPLATFELVTAKRLAAGLQELAGQSFDVVLLDLGLPDSQGLDTFYRLHRHYPALPVVVLSGLADEEIAIQTVQNGAQDYIVKSVGSLAALAHSVRYAVERQQAQQELRESENKFRSVVECSPDIIFTVDSQLRIQFINRVPAGLTVEEALGTSCLAYVPPEHHATVQNAVRQVFKTGQPGWYEIKTRGPNNAPAWYSTRLARLTREPQEPQVLLITEDITDRKQAEDALQQTEEKYARLFNKSATPAALGQLSTGVFVDVNEAFEKLSGYSRQEIIGKTGPEVGLITPETRAYVLTRLERQDTLTEREWNVRTKGGEERVALVNTGVVELGGQKYILSTIQDITGRKQAEEKLREREQQLQTIFDLLPVGVSRLNAHRQIIEANRALEEILGLSQVNMQHSEYTRRKYLRGDGTELAFEELPSFQAVRENQTIYNTPVGVVKEDGQTIWTSVSAAPLPDGGVLVVTSDLTAQKQAEQKLQELNQTLEERVKRRTAEVQDLYDNAPVGYHSLDGDGNFIRLNETALKWRGHARDEMIGRPFKDFIIAEHRPIFEESFRAFKQQGQMEDLEVEIIRKDGTTFPALLNATAIYDEAGNYVMSRSIVFDITERKKAEAALRESEEQNRLLFEESPNAVILFNMAGRMVRVNRAAEKLTGHPAARLVGHTWSEAGLRPPQQPEPLVAALEQALPLTDMAAAIEFKLVRANGEIRDVGAHIFGLKIREGRHYLAAIRDITQRKQTEQTLRLANAELARAARAKDEFLANMSHELRTPLNAILGLSEVLLEEIRGPINERQQAALHNIESSGRHLLSLINDILDISKMEAGRLELHPESVPVADMCQSSLVFIKETALKKQLRLTFNQDDPLAKVEADPKRLKQILINLLSNAVKFTPTGGHITLEVTTEAAAGVIRFAVKDTGIGISPAGLAQLFQPFTQLDSDLNRQYEGTGLGLALVRRLAELHGGSITVESEGIPGRGSCFTIALPYRSPATEAPAAPCATSLPASALVIEDTLSAVEQLERYLQELNIIPIIYQPGESIREQVNRHQPGVILLDLLMSGVSGWQILAQLKANPDTRNIPVIIISVVDERAKGLAAGAAAYLVKPISREVLRQALFTITPGSAGSPAAAPVVAPALTGARILLVEDNKFNIETIQDYLQDKGYQVEIAHNGQESLELARQTQPDLILMDIQQPGMDGLEATRRLRAIPEFAATPIIALTALVMPGDRERCLAAGVDEYLTKPVRLKGLAEIMENLLHKDISRD